jgi:NAD(P)H dehydrogenase (quinone)
MILVTGSAGKTGKAVVRRLVEQGQIVRALVFRAEQIQALETLGAHETLAGDMRSLDFVQRVLMGVDAVYHICPNVHPDEIAIGEMLIEAAKAVGIKHFVFHSVLHPQVEAMPHHWKKMRVEERLFESGLPYTILQPAAYMQNIMTQWENIVKTGKYIVPYVVESRISMVDLEDVAQVVAKVLLESSANGDKVLHVGATYELVGTPPMSQTEVADVLSQWIGHLVQAECLPIDDWKRRARASGLDDYRIDTLVKMFEYYEKHGFGGSPIVLSWLLNRAATSFDDFIKRVIGNQEYQKQ